MNDIIEHIYCNLDKLFTINYTLLAFIITATTILLMIQKGEIVELKNTKYYNDVIDRFYKALNFNLISGIISTIFYFLQIDNTYYSYIAVFLSVLFFTISLYYVYKSYDFLIFLIKHQK